VEGGQLVDKREVEYTEARIELLREMLRAGAFDMSDDLRRDFVAATVRDLRPRYPELGDHLWRQLIGNGIRATYGDATLAPAAAGRGEGDE
jgi:hypothetical protein